METAENSDRSLGAEDESLDHWRTVCMWLGLLLALITLVHFQTAARAVELWSSSSAYNYAFLVIPISAYLIWEDRLRVLNERAAPSILGVLVMLMFSFSWMVADAIGVNEGRQLSLVGMYQGAFLAVLGVRVFRILLFPFTYLWLLVPTGEFLVPTLQEITTFGSVWLLEISSIPTYYEGFLIQVPAGNFIVEPGCSGLNFILSSLALSLLYGKLTYRKWRTRLVCIFIALSMSVIGNILRVYLIIVLTQVTDRELNIADDHLLYGWGFFAVIMLVMMWIGLKFEDQTKTDYVSERRSDGHATGFATLPVATALVVLIAATPIGLRAAIIPSPEDAQQTINLPAQVGGWTIASPPANWSPTTVLDVPTASSGYTSNGRTVDVFVAYFPFQAEGVEPTAPENRPGDPAVWTQILSGRQAMASADGDMTVDTFTLRGPFGYRYGVSFSVSGDCTTTSRLISRLCGAPGKYGLGNPTGAYVVVSVQGQEDAATQGIISDFLSDMKPLDLVESLALDRSKAIETSAR